MTFIEDFKRIWKMKIKLSIIPKSKINNDIEGQTLAERAKLVLATLGETEGEIKKSYRKLVKQYHPDVCSDTDSWRFKIVNDAYNLLLNENESRNSLLADDELILKFTGKRVRPLLDRQKEWAKYEAWRRKRFYGIGVI